MGIFQLLFNAANHQELMEKVIVETHHPNHHPFYKKKYLRLFMFLSLCCVSLMEARCKNPPFKCREWKLIFLIISNCWLFCQNPHTGFFNVFFVLLYKKKFCYFSFPLCIRRMDMIISPPSSQSWMVLIQSSAHCMQSLSQTT